jgi:hypothetical protein
LDSDERDPGAHSQAIHPKLNVVRPAADPGYPGPEPFAHPSAVAAYRRASRAAGVKAAEGARGAGRSEAESLDAGEHGALLNGRRPSRASPSGVGGAPWLRPRTAFVVARFAKKEPLLARGASLALRGRRSSGDESWITVRAHVVGVAPLSESTGGLEAEEPCTQIGRRRARPRRSRIVHRRRGYRRIVRTQNKWSAFHLQGKPDRPTPSGAVLQ